MAAKLGDLDKVKQLVSEGAVVNIEDDNGVSAMRIYLEVFEQ